MQAVEHVLGAVRSFRSRFRVFCPGTTVLVAVSGGPDSVVLLDALNRLAGDFGIALHVAHLNHMFRGDESREDAAFVRELAVSLGISCTVEAVNVPAQLGRAGGGKQQQARLERYRFLTATSARIGASQIATGHNRDDLAETVIWRIARGTSLSGLAGIPPVRGPFVRPLLQVWRSEVMAYVSAAELEYRTDSSNLQPVYTRNWVRTELMPVLEKVNPAVRRALADLGDAVREDAAVLDNLAKQAYKRLADIRPGAVRLGRDGLQRLPAPLVRRILVRAVGDLDRELVGEIRRAALDAMVALLGEGRTGSRLTLPGATVLLMEEEHLVLAAAPRSQRLETRVLSVPGVTRLGDDRYIVAVLHSRMPDQLVVEPSRAYLDYDRVLGPLRVRSRHPGDSFCPFGMKGTKTVKNYLIEKKVPSYQRPRVPVVVDDRGVVWVAGFRMDDRYRVGPDTVRVLELRLIEKP